MITAQLKNTLAAELKSKNHSIVSGVPPKLGGQDEGMDPHEVLESALAACTIITVQMYARRKEWPLENIDVQVHVESEGKQSSKLSRKISFQGDLSEEQKQRLFEIAEKCPIHQILQSQLTIESTLAQA